jgi:hypothetical protein
MWLAEAPRRALAGVALAALWALLAVGVALPRACHVQKLELAALEGLELERCRFRWRGPNLRPPGAESRPAPAPGGPVQP